MQAPWATQFLNKIPADFKDMEKHVADWYSLKLSYSCKTSDFLFVMVKWPWDINTNYILAETK